MLNVVYLVLVLTGNTSAVGSTVIVPQANMAQCQTNLKNYGKTADKSYCIAGVIPK